jgi:integration host factor subunit alpha
MTLTKEAITHSVSSRLDLPKVKAAKAVEAIFEIIKKTLENGEDVLISGFEKFAVKDIDKRRGRNPGTGEELILSENGVVVTSKSRYYGMYCVNSAEEIQIFNDFNR